MRLHDLLDYQARERPDAEFALHRGRRITYREAENESTRLAQAFVRAGLNAGDRVAFLSKNSIEHVLLYFGASRAGVVPVPLNFRQRPEQWRFVIEDSGARALIASTEYAAAVETIRSTARQVEHWVCLGGEPADTWTAYDDWLDVSGESAPYPAVSPDDDLYQLYTSGTTGEPRGAVITHRALMAHLMQVTAFYGVVTGQRILVVTPLSHAHAAIQAFISACWGACLHIMDEFDAAQTVRVLSEERIAIAVLVPSMIRTCLVSVPDIARRRFDELRLMHYGAAPIAEHTLRHAMDVFGCDFVQGYGMTETTAGVTFLLQADHRRALSGDSRLLASAGRAALGMEVIVAGANDEPLPPGRVGQVIVRGPTLMRGYWKQPDATAKALKGGWMHTGDLGRMDEEGFLYIVDRANDVINSGGENVYPRAVEEVLFSHPAIADAAAIGIPDAQWGEAVKAVVVLRAGASATGTEILEFCGERLAGYQQPRSVDFCDALPYTASGKVMRRVLRERYWSQHDRRVGGA